MSDFGTIAGMSASNRPSTAFGPENSALIAVVSVDRLITGRVPPSEEMPYVRLAPDAGDNTDRTNATLYQAARIVFHIWSDTFDTGRHVATLIRNAFASLAFDWGTGGVLDMRWDGPPASHQTTDAEIKAWETVVTFTARTWEQRKDTFQFTSSSGD